MAHDRAGGDDILLTQEFLSMMLTVRRSSVTTATLSLQAEGFIRYARGQVTILDRSRLENFSCECYGIIKAEFDRLYS